MINRGNPLRPSRVILTQVNLLNRASGYCKDMTRTAADIRAQALAYRELHSHLQGPILTQAIEDVAGALDKLAASIEDQDAAVKDISQLPTLARK
ncbi:hypothetical protein [Sphingomonas faeni]|uniref:hypothetical protein n=1 Tax=Sphingomonas faeni TaxID=185950 RepID=UPI00334E0ECC